MTRWALLSIYEVRLMAPLHSTVTHNHPSTPVVTIKQSLWKVYGVSLFMLSGPSELIKNGNLYSYLHHRVGQLGLTISVGL